MTLRKAFITAYASALLALVSSPLAAQNDSGSCRSPANMGEYLATTYGEAPLFVLPEEEGSGPSLVLFMNSDTRSWTVIRVGSDQACMVAWGSDAETMAEFNNTTASLGDPL